MQFKKHKKKLLRGVGNIFVVPFVKVLCKTLKIEEINHSLFEEIISANGNVIFAFWHGSMLAPWFTLKKYLPSTIISQSKDGEFLAKLLISWNYEVNRGSSSKDGKEILDRLITDAKNKKNIAITPDGPKGPKNVMKAGAVVIAKKSGIPIVLLGVYYSRKISLKNWDNFEIPYPFSKAWINYSEPIFIDSELNYDETDKKIKDLNVFLNNLQINIKESCCR